MFTFVSFLQPPKRRQVSKKSKEKKKIVQKKKAKAEHPISSSSDSSDESDHDHGAAAENREDRSEDPPSEEEEDGEWEDLNEDSECEMDQALVQSLYKSIDDAKKTGAPFRKKHRRLLRAILEMPDMPS